MLLPDATESKERVRLPLGPPGHEHVARLALASPDEDVERAPYAPVSPRMLDAARAVAEALFSSDRGPPDAKRIDWLVADFGHFLARGGGRARLVMRLCLFAATWIAPTLVLRPFFALGWLPIPLRVRALSRVERSWLGPAALAPKAILCILWFEHPDTQRETRTEPTCLESTERA